MHMRSDDDDVLAGLQRHSDYCSEQASEARAMADQADDLEVKAIFEELARLYEALAKKGNR